MRLLVPDSSAIVVLQRGCHRFRFLISTGGGGGLDYRKILASALVVDFSSCYPSQVIICFHPIKSHY